MVGRDSTSAGYTLILWYSKARGLLRRIRPMFCNIAGVLRRKYVITMIKFQELLGLIGWYSFWRNFESWLHQTVNFIWIYFKMQLYTCVVCYASIDVLLSLHGSIFVPLAMHHLATAAFPGTCVSPCWNRKSSHFVGGSIDLFVTVKDKYHLVIINACILSTCITK